MGPLGTHREQGSGIITTYAMTMTLQGVFARSVCSMTKYGCTGNFPPRPLTARAAVNLVNSVSKIFRPISITISNSVV